jgi:hypothetical protein
MLYTWKIAANAHPWLSFVVALRHRLPVPETRNPEPGTRNPLLLPRQTLQRFAIFLARPFYDLER